MKKKPCAKCVHALKKTTDIFSQYCEYCNKDKCMLCYMNKEKKTCEFYEEYKEKFSESFIEESKTLFLFADGVAVACTDGRTRERLNYYKTSKAIEIAVDGFFIINS